MQQQFKVKRKNLVLKCVKCDKFSTIDHFKECQNVCEYQVNVWAASLCLKVSWLCVCLCVKECMCVCVRQSTGDVAIVL